MAACGPAREAADGFGMPSDAGVEVGPEASLDAQPDAGPCDGASLTACVYATETVCADLSSDRNNCGACGSVCPTTCVNGACVDGGVVQDAPDASCTADGETLCSSGCAVTATDPNNCGACGNVCMSGVCQHGHASACALPVGMVSAPWMVASHASICGTTRTTADRAVTRARPTSSALAARAVAPLDTERVAPLSHALICRSIRTTAAPVALPARAAPVPEGIARKARSRHLFTAKYPTFSVPVAFALLVIVTTPLLRHAAPISPAVASGTPMIAGMMRLAVVTAESLIVVECAPGMMLPVPPRTGHRTLRQARSDWTRDSCGSRSVAW